MPPSSLLATEINIMSDDGLEIRRPIPRRPFEIGIFSPTTDDDYDSPPPSPPPFRYDDDDCEHQPRQDRLDPNAFVSPPLDSKSRAASYKYLTSSTLSGIYSPNISGYEEHEDTLPAGPAIADAGIYKLVRERSSPVARRRSSAPSQGSVQQPSSPVFIGLRTGLLFLLGMGYGALLTRLSSEQKWAGFPVERVMRHGDYDGAYLAAWGLCGVVLGSLLPWFDGKWEQIFEKDGAEAIKEEEDTGTDWALVVRGVGAFAGIVFAIRKIPWASTMQVSLTLCMTNPLLWYLIDRSKPGFLLSAGTGLVGSIVLMGLNPDIMPTPTSFTHEDLSRNLTGQPGVDETLMLGGLATQKTIETGIWVISVIFCSCVCFGNIGRRLALNRSAAGRGRWGGLK